MSIQTLLPSPWQRFCDNNGNPLVGGLLYTYAAGTTTPAVTYTDATGLQANTNPIVLDFRGECNIWGPPNTAYKYTLSPPGDTNPPSNPIKSMDNIQNGLSLNNNVIGAALWPQSQAEINAGITPVNLGYDYGNILRFGIIPNSTSAAANNATYAQALWNPVFTNGPTGRFYFPNTTGTDVYYFSGSLQIRDGVVLDLQETTLNFFATYSTSWNTVGFIRLIRDVTIENGSITVNFNGSSGINAGMAILVGSREGYAFGTFTSGIFDQDDLVAQGLPPMGNVILRNLRITSNNPSIPTGPSAMILMFGGLRNVICENLWFTGQATVAYGIYYEFGFASTNGAPGNQTLWTSSHATALKFTNIHAENMNTTVSGGGGAVGLGGAYHAIIENVTVDSAAGVFTYTPGEALFYRPWIPLDAEGKKRGIIMNNLVGSNIVGNGLTLTGAQPATGYLSAAVPPLTPSQLVDLMTFSLDGASIAATSTGVTVSGDFIFRNAQFNGAAAGSQIVVTDDVVFFRIELCQARNSAQWGIRLGTSSIWSATTPRLKMGTIAECLIAGNLIGIVVTNTRALSITRNRLGYNLLYDAQAETTQTEGINVNQTLISGQAGAGGVVCDGNMVSTPTASGTAYVMSGTIVNQCDLRNTYGEITSSGNWNINGVPQAISANIASKTSYINGQNKITGQIINDTSNNRLLIALGPAPTDQWEIIPNSGATVTPS